MKILSIMGSPNPNGATQKVLSWVEEELKQQGHVIDRVNAADLDIDTSRPFRTNPVNEDGQIADPRDDGERVLAKFLETDGVILSTPLHVWGFSSQITPVIERLLCLVPQFSKDNHVSLIENKPMALVVTCAGGIEENADLIQTAFRRLCYFTKAHLAGQLIVPNCSGVESLSEETRHLAQQLGRDIA